MRIKNRDILAEKIEKYGEFNLGQIVIRHEEGGFYKAFLWRSDKMLCKSESLSRLCDWIEASTDEKGNLKKG